MAVSFIVATHYNFSGNPSSITQSHTKNASTDFIVVVYTHSDNNPETTSAWGYGGASNMTSIGSAASQGSNPNVRVEAYYKVAPASGAQNITITMSAGVRAPVITVLEFSGVDTVTPTANYNTNVSASATSLGVTVTAGGDGICVGAFGVHSIVTTPAIDTTTSDSTGTFAGSTYDVSWMVGHSTFSGSNITVTGSHASAANVMAGIGFRVVPVASSVALGLVRCGGIISVP